MINSNLFQRETKLVQISIYGIGLLVLAASLFGILSTAINPTPVDVITSTVWINDFLAVCPMAVICFVPYLLFLRWFKN